MHALDDKRDKYVPNSDKELLNPLELAFPYLHLNSAQANQCLAPQITTTSSHEN